MFTIRLLIFLAISFSGTLQAAAQQQQLSWIESANDATTDFPLQNLPYGVFSRKGSRGTHRIGVAIGDRVLDVRGCVEAGLLTQIDEETAHALGEETLNGLMRLKPHQWSSVRTSLTRLLTKGVPDLAERPYLLSRLLLPVENVQLHLPAQVGDYTDFYTSIQHATNVGTIFRPDNPLLPNFKHLPVGYHGRASSIIVSGTPIKRPMGQIMDQGASLPSYDLTRKLDYEMELAVFVGRGNPLGTVISIEEARQHLFGMTILNDWSARDVQKWEYRPLGPFNGKNFASTISPWVVTMEALDPYRVPGPPRSAGDPPTLSYLQPVEDMALNIVVEVYLSSEKMRRQGMPPLALSRSNFSQQYWTVAQMLVHHSSTGCNMRPGDLLGSGTISGWTEGSRGSLLELSGPGRDPLTLPDGTQRRFLEDGDQVIMRAYAIAEGLPRIGFGECIGTVVPSTL